MPQRRLFDRPDHDAAREERAETPHSPAGGVAQLLALQRSAGNAAVTRMLAAPSVNVAREDGYTAEAPSDADFTDSLAESESESDTESESESIAEGLDPGTRLDQALAMRIAEKGTAGQRPAIDQTNRYTAAAPDMEATSEWETESTSSETESESESATESDSEETSVSENTPVSARAIEVAAQVVAEDSSFTEVSADIASEAASEASEAAEVSGDEAASSSSSSSRAGAPAAPAQAGAPAAPSLLAVDAAAPVPVKKSAAKRALKALAKPVRALKRIFKGKKKKDLPTAAELLADEDAADVTGTGDAAATASSSSTSKSKSRSRRSRRTSRSESATVTVVQGVLDVTGVRSATSVSDTSAAVSADDESVSTAATATPPTAAATAADPNRAAPVKYDKLLKTLIPLTEEQDSSEFMNVTLLPSNALLQDMSRQGLIPMKSKMPPIFDDDAMAAVKQDDARVKDGLMRVWGWTDEEVRKYFVFEGHTTKGTKVEFIRSEADLKRYVVHPGTTMTYGERNDVFDTSKMVSKASGPGFAIFVMDPQGNIYAGQHRVGLFHHSSFTAGRDVVAAGEMKVTGGKLVELTSKSGHYKPTPEATWEVVKHMAALGVSFAGAQIKNWVPEDFPKKDGTGTVTMVVTRFHDGDEFLRLGPDARIIRKEFMYGAK